MKTLLLITLICSFSFSAFSTDEGEQGNPSPEEQCNTANGNRGGDTQPPTGGDTETTPAGPGVET